MRPFRYRKMPTCLKLCLQKLHLGYLYEQLEHHGFHSLRSLRYLTLNELCEMNMPLKDIYKLSLFLDLVNEAYRDGYRCSSRCKKLCHIKRLADALITHDVSCLKSDESTRCDACICDFNFNAVSAVRNKRIMRGTKFDYGAPTINMVRPAKRRTYRLADIYVYARKRPPVGVESNMQDCVLVPSRKKVILVNDKNKFYKGISTVQNEYGFDRVLDSMETNAALYTLTLKSLIECRNKCPCDVSYICFGQTGSGKTHSLFGDSKEEGIVMLTATDALKQTTRGLDCSFFEIYGNKVYDLLNDSSSLPVREDLNGNVVVAGLVSALVFDLEELRKLISDALSLRKSGQSSLNKNSSRSHAILQLAYLNDEMKKRSRIRFIDLAGSERSVDSRNNKHSAVREAADINQSLLALKECIRCIDQSSAYTPFRQSKLTHILKETLTGNVKTILLATISPTVDCLESSINTLDYASSLKRIRDLNLKRMSNNKPKAIAFYLDFASGKPRTFPITRNSSANSSKKPLSEIQGNKICEQKAQNDVKMRASISTNLKEGKSFNNYRKKQNCGCMDDSGSDTDCHSSHRSEILECDNWKSSANKFVRNHSSDEEYRDRSSDETSEGEYKCLCCEDTIDTDSSISSDISQEIGEKESNCSMHRDFTEDEENSICCEEEDVVCKCPRYDRRPSKWNPCCDDCPPRTCAKCVNRSRNRSGNGPASEVKEIFRPSSKTRSYERIGQRSSSHFSRRISNFDREATSRSFRSKRNCAFSSFIREINKEEFCRRSSAFPRYNSRYLRRRSSDEYIGRRSRHVPFSCKTDCMCKNLCGNSSAKLHECKSLLNPKDSHESAAVDSTKRFAFETGYLQKKPSMFFQEDLNKACSETPTKKVSISSAVRSREDKPKENVQELTLKNEIPSTASGEFDCRFMDINSNYIKHVLFKNQPNVSSNGTSNQQDMTSRWLNLRPYLDEEPKRTGRRRCRSNKGTKNAPRRVKNDDIKPSAIFTRQCAVPNTCESANTQTKPAFEAVHRQNNYVSDGVSVTSCCQSDTEYDAIMASRV